MILLALGSSLPFSRQMPAEIIIGALVALERVGEVMRRSRLYVSPAWPRASDPEFINAAAAIETSLSPEGLLAALLAVEAGFGRRRSAPNAPRTLDIDIIDFNGLIRPAGVGPPPFLPHPRAMERDFVLAPLAEVAPSWIHPVSGASVHDLLASLPTRTARPLEAHAALQRLKSPGAGSI